MMKRNRRLAGMLFIVMAILAFSDCMILSRDEKGSGLASAAKPMQWAREIENPHLENFHKVSDDLYRGAQPEEEGMRELEKMGIKTVINLRQWHSDRDELEGTSLKYVHFKLDASDAPDREDVINYLRVLNDKNNLPAFVHCAHGSDRTGMMVGVYRIIFQGWDRAEAVKEMTTGGFGYHSMYDDIVEFLKTADFDALKKAAGIK